MVIGPGPPSAMIRAVRVSATSALLASLAESYGNSTSDGRSTIISIAEEPRRVVTLPGPRSTTSGPAAFCGAEAGASATGADCALGPAGVCDESSAFWQA